MGGPGEVDFSQRMVLRGLSSAATGGDGMMGQHHLGKDGMTIQYDNDATLGRDVRFRPTAAKNNNQILMLDEEEEENVMIVDEDFDFNGGEGSHNEEYVKIQHYDDIQNKDSYSIIPFSGVQQHNPDSEYYDEDDCQEEISIEENKKTIQSKQSLIPNKQDEVIDENDPCVQNERLLEKYAHMLGAGGALHQDED